MTFLAYIVSIILFGVVDALATSLALMVATTTGDQVFKLHNSQQKFIFQFLCTIIGSFTGAYVALYSFSWFGLMANLYVALPLFVIVWYFLNLAILPEYQPTAQRLGILIGIVLSWIYWN
ncbi:hypothetical protein [Chryseosolibacter indicus]|uniref:EamA domain-containing protein n=1 Tax=Chryseosolibacter indicus TaxID=2782351 RepID=A0ABS5VYN4_9BACT|nr:hypothetical protein [Chryseosolibacter indicus]MBT1706416.1 hypothetical protein [Chryseosolibacter indicus]